jgi:hypothetical protein
MTERTVTQIRPENPEEKLLDEWFQKQALASPDNLESAARLLIGLVTGLLGTLLGILSLSAAKLPEYLSVGAVRWLGLLGVGVLLASVWFALLTVLPLRNENHPGRPDLQRAAFEGLVRWKSRTLTAAVSLFAVGLTCLALVLILALLHAAP